MTKKSLSDFAGIHREKRALLMGKGPSIDLLSQYCLSYGVVMACNEAIHTAVETNFDTKPVIYCVQQDMLLRGRCVNPKCDAHFIQSYPRKEHKKAAKAVAIECPDAVRFDPRHFGEARKTLTAVMGAHLLKHFGIIRVDLVGFDSWFGDNQYAASVEKAGANNNYADAHASHGSVIRSKLDALGMSWLLIGAKNGKLEYTNIFRKNWVGGIDVERPMP
jgi:hypothetical protein